MRRTPWLDLLRLPEKKAGYEYLQSGNRVHLRWMLAASTLAAVVVVLVFATDSQPLGAGPWFAVLAFSLALLLIRDQPFFLRHSDDFLSALLVLVLLSIALTIPSADGEGVFAFSAVVFPAFLVLLRWRGAMLLTLAGVFLATAVWGILQSGPAPSTPLLIIAPLMIGGAALVGWRLTRRRLAAFFEEYRRQVSVERDRARMSEELSDARAVQLSMLPHESPELPWVEVASASLPATEVGGDYYDYLALDDDRLAVVIGDVAGHGMASGLVLAGVRSGLHLLRGELDRGEEVLAKLNTMLRETSPSRMFVTFQIALLDRRDRTLTVANAGHPPLLVIPRDGGEAVEVGAAGPPLGTGLGAVFTSETRKLAEGDTLVLYTDGVSEVRNYRGESFETGRLENEARRAAGKATAHAALEELLGRVSHFKGDVEQEDDVTLVVLRLARDAGTRGLAWTPGQEPGL